MTPSLEAVSLTKKYGSFVALDNLNLHIEGSKCVGLLGPNGAGKTTTLKIFTDMIRASNGNALINGFPVHADKRKALRICGSLVETPEIYPALTPVKALSLVAELKGIPRNEREESISEVLDEVGIGNFKNKKLGGFSKGMKQRVNIAAAMVGDPEILLLDEPTTGLDPRGMMEVRGILNSLKGRGKLIFMSSHLLNEVEEVCDEVAIIEKGKLLAYDTLDNVTSRIYDNNREKTIDISFSVPVDSSSLLDRISALANVISVDPLNSRSIRIKFNGGTENQRNLLNDIGAMEAGMISFGSPTSALEDTYLSLVKDSR